ncbi:CocE/NonD family hydrolase C-terminal non-catalytic domain-containing protein [Streptomyces sp. NPDC002790]|uniref:CocE/NonD family hydrolase C-terminal non-catalytic domain-containing protein n=1 Tax=Streptomyces sp. NPDC002790 TaxID=3154431 RepID=UPI00331D58E0
MRTSWRTRLVHRSREQTLFRQRPPEGSSEVAERGASHVPAHTFDRIEKLSPGEVVDVEIDLLPVGLTFHPGEQLRFIVSGRSPLGTMMPGNREYTPANSGRHIIHGGGDHASYLQLPVKHA